MEKIIHQIWVGPYRIPKREQNLIQIMKSSHPNWKHMFWNDESISKLNIPFHIKEALDFYGNIQDYVAQCDILRMYVTYIFGGIYLDVDFETRLGLEPLNLEKYNGIFCYHPTDSKIETIPNGVLGTKKEEKLFKYFNDNVITNEFYTPHKIASLLRNYYNLEYETSTQYDLINKLKEENFFIIPYNDFHNNNCYHHALYSWGIEGKKKFKEDNYE